MLMRGSHDCPMHRQPSSLMQIQVTTTEGIRIWKPMWLIMVGQRRNELTITEASQSYRQRYDIEHPKRTRHEVIKKSKKEKKPEPTPIAV